MTRLLLSITLLFTYLGSLFAQPANDDLVNATVVTAFPFSETITSADGQLATAETDEIICISNNGTWWYTFTPTITNEYVIKSEVTGSNAGNGTDDIRLGIYTGTTHPLTQVLCFDNDNGDGFGEDEAVELTAGTTYHIQIAPQDGNAILDVTTSIIGFNTWTGAESSDWNNANNWSLAEVPNNASLTIIPGSVPNDVIISDGTAAVTTFLVLLDGTDLTIEENASLTINTDENDGLIIAGVSSTVQINGTLNISGTEEDGIDITAGFLKIGTTGIVNISNCAFGLYSTSSNLITVDGALNISDIEFTGIETKENPMTVSSSGTISLNNILDDGMFEVALTNNGTVTVNNIGDDGLDEMTLINEGTITIQNTTGDGLNVKGGTSENTSTGIITITESGEDGIDLDDTFSNSGTISISECTDFVLNDGQFMNQSGGILNADGVIEAISATFSGNSTLNPGASPGCLEFNANESIAETILNLEITGLTACTEYDQVMANGTLDITDAVLNVSSTYNLTQGDVITIIDNDGIESVIGTFKDLAEGTTFSVNTAEVSISYMGGDGNDVVLTTTVSALPLEWLNISASKLGNQVLLQWQTVSASDNNYFEIEHSNDQIEFQAVGEVEAISNRETIQNYEFAHYKPTLGLNYYRIKQVDLDGASDYSKVVVVEINNFPTATALRVFPNPAYDILNFQLPENQAIKNISIFDTKGKLVTNFNHQNDKISLTNLPSGNYILEVKTNNHIYQERIVKW